MTPAPLLAQLNGWPLALLAAYCVLIAAASFAGGFAPVYLKLSHRRLQIVISVVAGLMLGVGVLHMIPHAVREIGSIDVAMMSVLVGVLLMFFLLRAFHFHQHGGPAEADHQALHETCGHDHDHSHDHDHGYVHSHDHAHSHDDHHDHDDPHPLVHGGARPLGMSWLGIAFGLTIHTIIDGIALATSVQAESRESARWLVGVPAFLAILLHKPLDAASITSLMMTGGWNVSSRNMVNLGFALMVPLGALSFAFGVAYLTLPQQQIVGCALAFSGGVFVCIALADLLPEIEFHSHDRVLLSIALLAGVALAWAIGLLEQMTGHTH